MASIRFKNAFIENTFSVVGPMEQEGNIKKFDLTFDDYYYNEKTFEDAEVKMQKTVIENLLYKNKMIDLEVDYLISGDLSNQLAVSNVAASCYKISHLGVYSACATFTESLLLAAQFIDAKLAKKIFCVTSSHNLHAEKQFRFPVEYGSPKKQTTTFTATGSVGALVGKTGTIKIEGATIGNVVDMGVKDVSNMGAVMAPAASETLRKHLLDFHRTVEYYDVILTGDLGEVGSTLLKELMKRNYNIGLKNHIDAGSTLYKKEQEETYAGASGPVVLPLVCFYKILKNPKNKRILLLGTGSLHSTPFVNQKHSIPAICHAVSLEVIK